MALKSDFYSEIFEKETKWIELMNSNLLNSIYCKHSLQPFYIEKKRELENEFKLTHNIIIENFINIIDDIINQIELLNEAYSNNEKIDISTLFPLFLTTQMSTSVKDKKKDFNPEINKLQIRKQILENQAKYYNNMSSESSDYVYDDFPQEIRRIK